MIQHINIEDKEYPILFSMRTMFDFSKELGIGFSDIKFNMDYDYFLKLFAEASKKGAKKEDSDLVLTTEEFEDAIDEDPKLFAELQELFIESNAFKAYFGEAKVDDSEEESSKKK